MLLGVGLASLAGFGRDRMLKKEDKKAGSFLGGLIMAAIAGITSCGISLAFVYGQAPIVSAMKAHGAGDIPANFAVWAIGLLGGTLVNICFPIYLLCKNKSWGVFKESPKEALLASIIGVQFCLAVALMGKGMLMLGALGASVGVWNSAGNADDRWPGSWFYQWGVARSKWNAPKTDVYYDFGSHNCCNNNGLRQYIG